jgi:hypothetical protein
MSKAFVTHDIYCNVMSVEHGRSRERIGVPHDRRGAALDNDARFDSIPCPRELFWGAHYESVVKARETLTLFCLTAARGFA